MILKLGPGHQNGFENVIMLNGGYHHTKLESKLIRKINYCLFYWFLSNSRLLLKKDEVFKQTKIVSLHKQTCTYIHVLLDERPQRLYQNFKHSILATPKMRGTKSNLSRGDRLPCGGGNKNGHIHPMEERKLVLKTFSLTVKCVVWT